MVSVAMETMTVKVIRANKSTRRRKSSGGLLYLIASCWVVLCYVFGYQVGLNSWYKSKDSSYANFYAQRLLRHAQLQEQQQRDGYQYDTTEMELLRIDTFSPNELDIRIENDYTSTNPVEHPKWLIVEPWRVSYLHVTDTAKDLSADEVTYTWSINDVEIAVNVSFDDVPEYTFEELAEYAVTVQATCSRCVKDVNLQHLVQRTYTQQVMCRYVRRELRQLSDQDRELFLDTMEILYRTEQEEGKKKYGPTYKGIDYFVAKHLHWGAQRDCDHWHEGPGFVTSHMAFSLEFEQAMQLIEPAVTLPYWDFTLESTFYNVKTWRGSQFFADDWFGSSNPANQNHVLDKGRWAYIPVKEVSAGQVEKEGAIRNAWGLMRSPWNLDPTPYLTRGAMVMGFQQNLKPRGCESIELCMDKDNWMELSMCLNTYAHGHVHELVGGSWSQPTVLPRLKDFFGFVQDDTLEFIHAAQAFSKQLWRAGYMNCPTECVTNDNNSNGRKNGTTTSIKLTTTADKLTKTQCRCSCDQTAIDIIGPYEVLRDAGVLGLMATLDSDGLVQPYRDLQGELQYHFPLLSNPNAILKEVVESLCDPGYIGDMFHGSSPLDPIFWVIHPHVDRIWHAIRLFKAHDEEWIKAYQCDGQDPHNPLPFSANMFVGVSDQILSNGKKLTNAELYGLFDPNAKHLPYFYDHYRWSHCSHLGYDLMKSLIHPSIPSTSV